MCILVLSVNQVFVFLGSLGQFGHGAVGCADSAGEFWFKAQDYGVGGTEVGEFVDYLVSVFANFDFRGMADILYTHIGLFETQCGAKFVGDAASECVATADSSAKSMPLTSTGLTLVLAQKELLWVEWIASFYFVFY